jgi:hypothetical protein
MLPKVHGYLVLLQRLLAATSPALGWLEEVARGVALLAQWVEQQRPPHCYILRWQLELVQRELLGQKKKILSNDALQVPISEEQQSLSIKQGGPLDQVPISEEHQAENMDVAGEQQSDKEAGVSKGEKEDGDNGGDVDGGDDDIVSDVDGGGGDDIGGDGDGDEDDCDSDEGGDESGDGDEDGDDSDEGGDDEMSRIHPLFHHFLDSRLTSEAIRKENYNSLKSDNQSLPLLI